MTKIETILSDIYDAWRAQDVAWLGGYLPEDFSHMVYVPTEIHPLGGLCRGKAAALRFFLEDIRISIKFAIGPTINSA